MDIRTSSKAQISNFNPLAYDSVTKVELFEYKHVIYIYYTFEKKKSLTATLPGFQSLDLFRQVEKAVV